MKLRHIILVAFSALPLCYAQAIPFRTDVNPEARPAARWWWLGSAVDEKNLTYNLEAYAAKGMGSLEITPIYGVQGNDANNISFLSPRWMELLKYTQQEGKRLGIQIDMNTGTGWPFGGPEVQIKDAASKLLYTEYEVIGGQQWSQQLLVDDPKQQQVAFLEAVMAFEEKGKKVNLKRFVDQKGVLTWKVPTGKWHVIAVFCGKTFQKVKRAAPGGEGYVMNHFSKDAVAHYLTRFEKAFQENGVDFPHNFFNDSYEVYKADWTPGFLEDFYQLRGYRLEEYLPEFLGARDNDMTRRLIADYRETLGELLLNNFTRQWSRWAQQHGSQTRNQAHGSPGNLIDLYSAVSVPECESFGISDFGIKGLRKDSLKKMNDSDLSMLKYASSAAHINGKPFVSSETFTWLTEHFRTSLSQCKPDLDLMFLSGVNHTFFHGTPYSPMEAEWPGWLFYAAINMSPTNSIWRDAKPFFEYITRTQSFLQEGKPDNDFLVYLPVYDMWHEQDGRLLMFDIHKMKQRAPEFIQTVTDIVEAGYDVDYISDQYLLKCRFEQGRIRTLGADYAAIVVPAVHKMPAEVLRHLNELSEQGAKIVYLKNYPQDVPGLAKLPQRRKQFERQYHRLPKAAFNSVQQHAFGKGMILTGSQIAPLLAGCNGKKEVMKSEFQLKCIRRSTPQGYNYFISALKSEDTRGWIPLGVSAEEVVIENPLTGDKGVARTRSHKGMTEVLLDLKSGESVLLRAFHCNSATQLPRWKYFQVEQKAVDVKHGWKLRFMESAPAIVGSFAIDTLCSWTQLPVPEASCNMGTALYEADFELTDTADEWLLSLGDVRESACIRINGEEVTTLWSVPYEIKVGKYLRRGMNHLSVEVTNLPANRIADFDRKQIPWRKFNEVNIVDINYKKDLYSDWEPMPSGLCGPVYLYPCHEIVQ